MKILKKTALPLAILMSIVLNITSAAAATTFDDVPEDHKAYVPVTYLANKGCVNGRSEGVFAPDEVISRVEVLKLLTTCLDLSTAVDSNEFILNAGDTLIVGDEEITIDRDGTPISYVKNLNLPAPEDDPMLDFADVKLDMWYVPYLQKALHLEIVKGYSDGTVKPLEQVSLAELLTLLLRVKKMEDPNIVVDLAILPSYIDEKAWYANGIAFGLQEKLISIVDDKQLAPFYKLNRAEAVILVYNYLVASSEDDNLSSSESVTTDFQAEADTQNTTEPPKQDSLLGFSEEGVASYYGWSFDGANTASGEKLDINAYQAAHKTLPFNTVIRITNLDDSPDNPRWVEARIVDRGPYVDGRVVDLTPAAFEALENLSAGLARVKIEVISLP